MNDARREERRRALITATKKVVRQHGISGANVRAVAAEAAVSTGAVLYYFPNFEGLMASALEGVVEEFYSRRREALDQYSDPAERVSALIAAGIPDQASDDLRLLYESIPLIRQSPELRPLHRSVVERQVMLYVCAIELGVGLGSFTLAAPLETIARNIVALEDAYDMYPLIGLTQPAAEYRANVRSYAQLALGCEIPEI
ncbi:hypothetical protein UM93_10365 [Psychromicrobium lacuslunae]|uniref:HTH tetR-type domain-containing protein n=2 Tax=Psychromicrobium lacuslunae TaxID=1618207 RepID=A0A0D4C377_9MICC|nr:hypothetical protein UM93_10365 [Psychromicrobium lacuslunae]